MITPSAGPGVLNKKAAGGGGAAFLSKAVAASRFSGLQGLFVWLVVFLVLVFLFSC